MAAENVTPVWFTALQSFGIVSAFGLTAWTAWRSSKSNQISNYLQLTQFHREIWSRTLDNTKYDRIRSKEQFLWTVPVTEDERQFMVLIFLHITCSYELAKSRSIIKTDGLKVDIKDFLSYPLPRRHWEETKRFFNDNFVKFMDSCAPKISHIKPISKKISTKKILVISSAFAEKLLPTLRQFPDHIIFWDEKWGKPTKEYINEQNIDFIIVFGSELILSQEVVQNCTALNLHGGFLPWNRGPNPNLWSWIDNTPKGVSIHQIDKGIDTGAIYAQKKLSLKETMTLQQTFDAIIKGLTDLFAESWSLIRDSQLTPSEQSDEGSSHTFKDQKPYSDILENALDRPMKDIVSDIKKVK